MPHFTEGSSQVPIETVCTVPESHEPLKQITALERIASIKAEQTTTPIFEQSIQTP